MDSPGTPPAVLYSEYYVARVVDGDEDAAGGTTCHGARCFPYPVVAALNASAVAAALLLTYGPWAPRPLATTRSAGAA